MGFCTGVAIWVLIGGSVAVFVWFVRDLLRLGMGLPDSEAGEEQGEQR